MHRMFILCSFIVAIACNGFVTPPTGPNTEYPCGVWGVECEKTAKGSMCCPQNHICGYDGQFSRCPSGTCCYDGDHWPFLAEESDAGKAQSLIPQYKVNSHHGIGQ